MKPLDRILRFLSFNLFRFFRTAVIRLENESRFYRKIILEKLTGQLQKQGNNDCTALMELLQTLFYWCFECYFRLNQRILSKKQVSPLLYFNALPLLWISPVTFPPCPGPKLCAFKHAVYFGISNYCFCFFLYASPFPWRPLRLRLRGLPLHLRLRGADAMWRHLRLRGLLCPFITVLRPSSSPFMTMPMTMSMNLAAPLCCLPWASRGYFASRMYFLFNTVFLLHHAWCWWRCGVLSVAFRVHSSRFFVLRRWIFFSFSFYDDADDDVDEFGGSVVLSSSWLPVAI